jgi:hypothetical protein
MAARGNHNQAPVEVHEDAAARWVDPMVSGAILREAVRRQWGGRQVRC